MTSTISARTATRSARLPALAGRWLAAGLAFPPAGLLVVSTVGPIDRPIAAAAGGAVAGAVVGAGQWLALRHRASRRADLRRAWIGGTAAAMAAGLTAGAALVGYRTSTPALVAMGLVTGAAVGATQSFVLRWAGLAAPGRAAIWAVTVPLVFGLGWFVTSSVGVDVERRYAVFGSSGALTSAAIGGLVLDLVVVRRAVVGRD